MDLLPLLNGSVLLSEQELDEILECQPAQQQTYDYSDDESEDNAGLPDNRPTWRTCFPRLDSLCSGNAEYLDMQAIRRAQSKIFRGIPCTTHPMWKRYVADKSQANLKSEKAFLQVLGQFLRFALANGDVLLEDMGNDFALLSVLNPRCLTAFVRFGENVLNWSKNSLHSYTTTIKTGFRRLIKWLDVDAR